MIPSPQIIAKAPPGWTILHVTHNVRLWAIPPGLLLLERFLQMLLDLLSGKKKLQPRFKRLCSIYAFGNHLALFFLVFLFCMKTCFFNAVPHGQDLGDFFQSHTSGRVSSEYGLKQVGQQGIRMISGSTPVFLYAVRMSVGTSMVGGTISNPARRKIRKMRLTVIAMMTCIAFRKIPEFSRLMPTWRFNQTPSVMQSMRILSITIAFAGRVVWVLSVVGCGSGIWGPVSAEIPGISSTAASESLRRCSLRVVKLTRAPGIDCPVSSMWVTLEHSEHRQRYLFGGARRDMGESKDS
ncbi:hypothetical protein DFH08DRAFT_1044070 [Mycena albidolilacea]|uniref:Uncharacterized protein n=1 Tax=Mycena albidolilacea TaxID=1033008 RepID=A0AAD6Z9H9_9AGAR|nr:hypothetical protein DFH08DRAFT_1044070 [Mycena albidolilacea]